MKTSHARIVPVVGLMFGVLVAPSLCRADPIVISGGYELESAPSVLLRSLFGPPATYSSTPVPLGSYDFGTGSGAIDTGTTSFLLDRLNTITLATIGSTASVRILQLAFTNRTDSVVPYSSFQQGATGSGHVTASVSPLYTAFGQETITRTSDTGGTFTLSYMNRILFSAEDGTPLSTSPVLSITSANGVWQSAPPSGAEVIPGVNNYNFFITDVDLQNSVGNALTLTEASQTTVVSEPASWGLVGAGLAIVGLAALRRRMRRGEFA